MTRYLHSGIIAILCQLIFAFNVLGQSYGDRLDLDPQLAPFYHGVASGDPTPNNVIIWTRITTDLNEVAGVWRIATDSFFTQNTHTGTFSTSAARDFTVKIDVGGLLPNTNYYYDFQAIGARSLIGRTKTAPANATDQYRIVFVSCSDMNTGFYNVYERIKERNDFDAIYHLGDYLYEYQDDRYVNSGLKARDVEPDYEIITLTDYRTRYNFYRLDPKLRDLHQQYPWVLIWDDHETANDSYKDGAQNHQPNTEGSWEDRKAAGVQAYLEWMPIRENPINPVDISRSFKIGDLVEFYALEARLNYKTEVDAVATLFPASDNSNRGMLGPVQRNWLQQGMLNTDAQWKVMVSPTIFTTFYYTAVFKNGDAWDGYPWERKQIVNFVKDNNINNFVVISGDIHMSMAFDIPHKTDDVNNPNQYNSQTGEGSVGVNFVGTGPTSVPCCRGGKLANYQINNQHLKYANFKKNGYCLLDVTPEKITCDYFYVDTVLIEDDVSHYWEASWCVIDSEPHLVDCGQPSTFNGIQYPFAPSTVGTVDTTLTGTLTQLGDILGVYPVPAVDFVGMQFFLQASEDIVIDIIDLSGKVMIKEAIGVKERGMHFYNTKLNKLASGEYIISIRTKNNSLVASRRIIKQ
ncbi:MAG: alkaline phosphatase D family protein [Chitinophagales bacterium]